MPVVATSVGGNPELVDEGKNGFLVPVGNIELIAEKVLLLLQEKTLHHRIREENLSRVASEFSLIQMVKNYENYYETILKV